MPPPGWDNLMTALGADEAATKRLDAAGLLAEGSGGRRYDRFRERVMFRSGTAAGASSASAAACSATQAK